MTNMSISEKISPKIYSKNEFITEVLKIEKNYNESFPLPPSSPVRKELLGIKEYITMSYPGDIVIEIPIKDPPDFIIICNNKLKFCYEVTTIYDHSNEINYSKNKFFNQSEIHLKSLILDRVLKKSCKYFEKYSLLIVIDHPIANIRNSYNRVLGQIMNEKINGGNFIKIIAINLSLNLSHTIFTEKN